MIRWSRQNIKEDAKDFLRYNYWKAFVACLIVSLLTGVSAEVLNLYEGNYNFSLGATVVFAFIIIAFAILAVTVGYALEVGLNRFFLDGFKGEVSINKVFSTFNSDEYLSIAKTQLLKDLYSLLWTLLFIIPGIIKSYEYRFVPYILTENPNLTANEIISKSRDMTYGHKMDMFVLDLSFIGWSLLGMLFCGIGIFFVIPYIDATIAKLYNVLAGKDSFYYNSEDGEDKDFDIIVE